MSEYMDTHQKTVSDILAKLSAEVAALQSSETTAEYKLYYGQGANITAHDKYNAAYGKYQKTSALAQVGVENDNKCTKVIQTATTTQQDVATAVANAATAANNVQVAANAISQLAADIGSAYNIVAATDFNSDIFSLTSSVNRLVSETAGHAEEVSWRAMDASTQTAEIIAGQVLKDANLAKADIEVILAGTNAKLANLTAQLEADSQKIAKTAKAERVAEGTLQDDWQNLAAVKASYKDAVSAVNYGLTIGSPDPATPLKNLPIHFDAFQMPFELTNVTELDGVQSKFQYYLLVAPATMRDSLNLEKAESLYAREKDAYFLPCQPDKDGKGSKVSLTKKSIDGLAVTEGVSYSLFLYIDVPLAYKKYTNNFSDCLSASTEPLTFQKVLKPWNFDIPKSSNDPNGPGTYTLSGGEYDKHMEYRCMFLPVSVKGVQHLLTADQLNPSNAAGPGFFFDQAVAGQVTAANYSLAKPGKQTGQLEVEVTDATTDNFGNLLLPGASYLPAVFAIMTQPNEKDLITLASSLNIGASTFVPVPNSNANQGES